MVEPPDDLGNVAGLALQQLAVEAGQLLKGINGVPVKGVGADVATPKKKKKERVYVRFCASARKLALVSKRSTTPQHTTLEHHKTK